MKSLTMFAALLAVCVVASTAVAHDDEFITSFNDVGPGSAQYEDHFDLTPYKGWVTVNVTNNSNVDWGSFHFFIFSMGADISNVSFMEGMFEGIDTTPTSSQSGLTWDIDNVSVGAKIDLLFPEDAVLIGQQAWFNVYTSNPDQINFGVAFYPVEIPEPATMGLLGLGLAAVLARKRRKA